MKHTPGSWEIGSIDGRFNISSTDHGRDNAQEITGESDLYIYGGKGTDSPIGCLFTNLRKRDMLDKSIFPEQKANANLIAAAPDLLDICQHILDAVDNGEAVLEDNEQLQGLREAISKAERKEAYTIRRLIWI